MLAAGLALLALVLLILAGGWAYQSIADKRDRKRYPPPGRLIDIGGRRLHLLFTGTAPGPTVVIEAGGGNDCTLWGDILRQVAAYARVCVYDRAGLGWSDPAPLPRTFENRAGDLHALLTKAGAPAPYLLVGHSYGGHVVRWFARRYPGEVAGIVLVDSSEEGYAFDPWGLKHADEVRARELRLGWMARLGWLRLAITRSGGRFDPLKGVPAAARGEMAALYLRSSRHFAFADEMAAYRAVPEAMRKPGGFGALGNIPLIVISRAARDPASGSATPPEWLAAQDRLVALSMNSRHIAAEKSGHMIQFDQPQVIVDAIRQLWASSGWRR